MKANLELTPLPLKKEDCAVPETENEGLGKPVDRKQNDKAADNGALLADTATIKRQSDGQNSKASTTENGALSAKV